DLRGMENSLRAAAIADQQGRVVLEPAAGHERGELRAELLNFQAADVAPEIFRVRADVSQAAAGTGAFRIGAPTGLLRALRFDLVEQPALRIFGHDLENFSKFTATDMFARFLDHRVAGVIVREA